MFDVTPAADSWSALEQLARGRFDALLVALPLAEACPGEFMEHLGRVAPRTPCVFLAAPAGESLAEALTLVRLGAFDYLPAEAPASVVQESLVRAIETYSLPNSYDASEPWRQFIVGDSPAITNVIETIRLIGPRRSTVFITGETGTGKEVVARAIHAMSARSTRPLVAVNCGALPENLLESELFGHVRGAFTGAIQNRIGRFEKAHQGTLFLDEVTDLPLDLQAKLLRVLQEKEFQRLGSSETVRVDVRVIAASNADPAERVRAGRFREDLYYRLNVVPVAVPPLRERLSDIPLLVKHFLDKVCRQEEIPPKRASAEALERLMRHRWPGNVRELENAVEKAVALSGANEVLTPRDFPLEAALSTRPVAAGIPTIVVPDGGLDFEEVVSGIERGLLSQALSRTRGNKKLAADLLRLKRTTLTAKLRSLDIWPAQAATTQSAG